MEVDQHKLIRKFQIRSFDVDLFGKLTLPALCNYFQEIAWEHAKILNIGFDFLKSINKFWVLSRLQVNIFKYPSWTEEISIITWPKGIDGLFALRDFEVYNVNGEKIAAASSSWLILDNEKHRPQKIDSGDHPVIISVHEDSIIKSTPKLPSIEHPENSEKLWVKHTDIDVNKHVNNVKYIEWSLNTQTSKLRNYQIINEMVVNFLSEASLDDQMEIKYSIDTSSKSGISIHNISKMKESCRILFTFSS